VCLTSTSSGRTAPKPGVGGGSMVGYKASSLACDDGAANVDLADSFFFLAPARRERAPRSGWRALMVGPNPSTHGTCSRVSPGSRRRYCAHRTTSAAGPRLNQWTAPTWGTRRSACAARGHSAPTLCHLNLHKDPSAFPQRAAAGRGAWAPQPSRFAPKTPGAVPAPPFGDRGTGGSRGGHRQ